MDSLFFYAFAALILAGAVLTVILRNPVHCAMGLLGSLLGVAGLFLLEHAEFLFAAQLVVYAGGVVLLFLFVIMLVNLDQAEAQNRFTRWWWVGLAGAAAVGVQMWRFSQISLPPASGEMPAQNTEAIGNMLLSDYLLPFEIVSILLLGALVGSVAVARGEA